MKLETTSLQNQVKSSPEQREELLKLNPDLVFGVYDINKDFGENYKKHNGIESDKISIQTLRDTLACYPNQFQNLRGLSENKDVLIIDLNELRNGGFKILAGEKNDDILRFHSDGSYKYDFDGCNTAIAKRNLCLVSNGVIELIDSEYKTPDGKTEKRTHTFTSLRDGGATDVLQRTSVAGRNYSDSLVGDLETEYTEENPFLGVKNGKYYLFTPRRSLKGGIKGRIIGLLKGTDEIINDLKKSVFSFLSNKYTLDRNNPADGESIKLFERNFKGIKYEKLGDILREIIENSRIELFDNTPVTTFEGLEGDIKTVEITDFLKRVVTNGKFFVFYDKENNTFEYRALRKIKLPDQVNPRQRLFLESQNQGSETHRLEALGDENLVPTMRYFAEKVKNNELEIPLIILLCKKNHL